jgi:hypothetical protein
MGSSDHLPNRLEQLAEACRKVKRIASAEPGPLASAVETLAWTVGELTQIVRDQAEERQQKAAAAK